MDFTRIVTCKGWHRRGLAAGLGICAAVALPPLYILPLLIPAFAGLFLLCNAAPTHKQAFWDGWWWGLGHFTVVLYWICISLYVEPEKFAWLTPFALFGVPSVLGIYTGIVTLITHCVKMRPVHKIVLFCVMWVAVEYLRAHLFTGFPWCLIGYVWTVSDVTIQTASFAGIYGLSWLAVLVATMPALFHLKECARSCNAASAFILFLCLAFGLWRLDAYPMQLTATKLRIVQGNIPESVTRDPHAVMAGLKTYVDLTRSPGIAGIDIVVWPESSVPYYLEPDSALAHDLGEILPAKSILITGGMRASGNAAHWQAWNTLFAINSAGSIVAQYDKHHLVPFGEYIPLRYILPLEAIAGGHGDFSMGNAAETLAIPPYEPFSPLICYEAIFPDEATDGTGQAKWLVNVTNDAWFGMSAGPYQHLQMSRVRAVEEGLPLIRAANTGISAEYDSLGRKVGMLALGEKAILDVPLASSFKTKSIHSRFPFLTILFMIVCSGFILSFSCVKHISKRQIF